MIGRKKHRYFARCVGVLLSVAMLISVVEKLADGHTPHFGKSVVGIEIWNDEEHGDDICIPAPHASCTVHSSVNKASGDTVYPPLTGLAISIYAERTLNAQNPLVDPPPPKLV